ncbi:MAG TPA: hypothetical protein VL244_03265 [Alphaproteobacteria bacterium]|nr:hypothetical protein [Alphaproteobacteria bacterium]
MRLRWWPLIVLALGFAPAAQAQSTLSIKAFFGSYSGTGVAENKDSVFFGVTQRDFDVVIHPDGAGFSLAWTTVAHEGGDPAKPKIKRKQDQVSFVPGPSPETWRTAAEPDPFSGNPLIWARIERTTLIVNVLTIDPQGRAELQRYARTISGGGMDLVFTTYRDGERTRTVKGKLVKNAN